MSWRIENTDPLELMRELPNAWAQTCLLRPPRDLPDESLLALLAEAHRVVRDDGTLWLTAPTHPHPSSLAREIHALGWQRHTIPSRPARGMVLFAKQPRFYLFPRWPLTGARRPQACPHPDDAPRVLRARRRVRIAVCVPARELVPSRVIEWCILAGSSPRACGVCGAPWRRLPARAGHPERWRPGCQHVNDRGSSLVLEPFCGLARAGEIATRQDRGYLGIEPDHEIASRARHRLTNTHKEPKR